MNEKNLVLLTYTSVQPFLELTKAGSRLKIQLDRLENRIPDVGGFYITSYVIAQIRIGDELHLLKFIGKPYQYWGPQFEDHVTRQKEAVSWAVQLSSRLEEVLIPDNEVILGTHYHYPELVNAPGVYVGLEIPAELTQG